MNFKGQTHKSIIAPTTTKIALITCGPVLFIGGGSGGLGG